MSTKLCLLLIGTVVFIAIFASASAEEEVSLSEDVAASRLVREAAADPRKSSRKGKRKAKKSKKNGKKSRKSKKSKKSAKRSKKNKKRSKKSKQKKGRKNRKNNRKSNGKDNGKGKNREKKKGDKRQSSSAIDVKCVAQLTLAMRRWKDVVTNFQRQSKRITDNMKKGAGKSAKSNVFAPVAEKLISAGGGNMSALECGGNADSEVAKNLTQLGKV